MAHHNAALAYITKGFDFMAPGEIRSYAASQLENAKRWISVS